jgi:hypothetical protein
VKKKLEALEERLISKRSESKKMSYLKSAGELVFTAFARLCTQKITEKTGAIEIN